MLVFLLICSINLIDFYFSKRGHGMIYTLSDKKNDFGGWVYINYLTNKFEWIRNQNARIND